MVAESLLLNCLMLPFSGAAHPSPAMVFLWRKEGRVWRGIFFDGIDFSPSFLLSALVSENEISFVRFNRRRREEEKFTLRLGLKGVWEGSCCEKVSDRICLVIGVITTNLPT